MNTQKPSTWKKYFSGKNLFINIILIIIPASLTIGILKEILTKILKEILKEINSSGASININTLLDTGALIYGLIYMGVWLGVWYGFIYLIGSIREESLNKKDAFKNISIFYITYFMVLIVFGSMYSSTTHKDKITTNDLVTDKSEPLPEMDENIYRNTKHNFSIKFPKGWEIKPGNGPDTIQKAVNGHNSISINIKESANEYTDQKMTIKDILSLEEFKSLYRDILIEKYPRLELLDHGETKLDGIPTYYIKFNTPYTSEDSNSEYTSILYQLVNKKIYYSITVVSPTDDFDSMEETLNKSVNTFVIEDNNQ